MAAFKELDVRSTSSIVRLIHSESSITVDSVDDDMADLLLLPMVVVRHVLDTPLLASSACFV